MGNKMVRPARFERATYGFEVQDLWLVDQALFYFFHLGFNRAQSPLRIISLVSSVEELNSPYFAL